MEKYFPAYFWATHYHKLYFLSDAESGKHHQSEKKGEHVGWWASVCFAFGDLVFIKITITDSLGYETTHFGTTPVIVDWNIRVIWRGGRISGQNQDRNLLVFGIFSDIDAVCLCYSLIVTVNEEKVLSPTDLKIDAFLVFRRPKTIFCWHQKNQLEVDLHALWKDQLPYLKVKFIGENLRQPDHLLKYLSS